MKIYELLYSVEIQSPIHYCYYDYDKEERIEVTKEQAEDKEITWLYSENDELYVEFRMED